MLDNEWQPFIHLGNNKKRKSIILVKRSHALSSLSSPLAFGVDFYIHHF